MKKRTEAKSKKQVDILSHVPRLAPGERSFTPDSRRSGYLTEQQAAEYLNVSVAQMRNWRYRGGGPKITYLGKRCVRYAIEDLDDFARSKRVSSTSAWGRIKNML